MSNISTVKPGDLVSTGLTYRKVLNVERVPDPTAPTAEQRERARRDLDALAAEPVPPARAKRAAAALAKARKQLDNGPPAWVQLTVEVDGQPQTWRALPPDHDVDVERAPKKVDDDDYDPDDEEAEHDA
jgi:hypothetical protein